MVKEDYRTEINNPNSLSLTLKVGSHKPGIIGFLLAKFSGEINQAGKFVKYSEADIINFAVLPEFQKKGVGSELFSAEHNEFLRLGLESIWLEVRQSNLNAVRFYLKNGFKEIQVRKNFYTMPNDHAVVMKLDLIHVNKK